MHVLLTFEDYQRRSMPEKNLADMLSQKEGAFFEFDPPKLTGPFSKPVDFD